MRKITLLVASIFLMGGVVANAGDRNERRSAVDFRNADPIVFVERGIEFYIFADGQFDFNTHPSNGGLYYRSNKKNIERRTYVTRDYGVKVEHDSKGRIRRVGNVFVNYDAYGRIKRAGSVYMNYNRYALTQVGGLQIIYNHRGQIVDFVGAVNGGRDYQYTSNNNDYNNYDYSQQNSNAQDDVYYRTNGGKPKVTGSLDIRINN
ncbi:hypothetical protein [Flavobacterium limnophilum]|uniref:hypothetical protein n=1 Tax=Flavobacterium limnophilum TaxID=3003262 RepID=UPI0024827D5E|nr:hypothetical protein [Flavobacterium limnophilum]